MCDFPLPFGDAPPPGGTPGAWIFLPIKLYTLGVAEQ
jgi:hypothetical protein